MSVENKTTLTFGEITFLIGLLKTRIEVDEKQISFVKYSSFYPETKASIISHRTKSIEHDRAIIEKLRSLSLEVSRNERT